MCRQRTALIVISLSGILLLVDSTSAQVVTPLGPICTEGVGPSTATLGNVPLGQRFVMTDFIWSPRVSETSPEFPVTTTIRLFEDTQTVWLWSRSVRFQGPGTYEVLPIEGHWGTVLGSGLGFDPGTGVGFQVEHVPPGLSWAVCWTGYLIPYEQSAIEDVSAPPASMQTLQQNAPNPFSHTTEIRYTLASPGRAQLRIYDAQGRLVRTLDQDRKETKENSIIWDGRNESGQMVASGIYYYELLTDAGKEARKAIMLR